MRTAVVFFRRTGVRVRFEGVPAPGAAMVPVSVPELRAAARCAFRLIDALCTTGVGRVPAVATAARAVEPAPAVTKPGRCVLCRARESLMACVRVCVCVDDGAAVGTD